MLGDSSLKFLRNVQMQGVPIDVQWDTVFRVVTNGESSDNRATGAIIVFGVSSFHTTVGKALRNSHAARYDRISTVYSHTRYAGDGRSPSSSLPYNSMRSTAAGVVTGIPSMSRPTIDKEPSFRLEIDVPDDGRSAM